MEREYILPKSNFTLLPSLYFLFPTSKNLRVQECSESWSQRKIPNECQFSVSNFEFNNFPRFSATSVSLSTCALNFMRVNFLKIHVTYLLIIFQLFSFNDFNTLSANFTKWSNTLTQFVSKLPTNCLSWFNHPVGLALKGLKYSEQRSG